jgi:hypothetical protein
MTGNTLSLQERLTEIAILLPELQRLADAELGFITQCADGGPWSGSLKRLDELQCEARDLRLQIRGLELRSALDRLRSLDAELDMLQGERNARDQHLRELAKTPVIAKWLLAPEMARRYGWGSSFEQWAAYFCSGKPFRLGAAPGDVLSAGVFFANGQCPELKFNHESDRATVMSYVQARADCDKTIMAWQDCCDRRQRLLQSHPELSAAA